MTIDLLKYNYVVRIEDYLSSSPPIEDYRKEKIKNLLRNGERLIIDCPVEQQIRVFKIFDKLMEVKPGIELLERIFTTQIVVKLKVGDRNCAFTSENEINIQLDKIVFCAGINLDQNLELYKANKTTILAHELLHLLHRLEKTRGSKIVCRSELLHRDYDNAEEQYTITGLKKIQGDYWSLDPLCENAFHLALGDGFYRVFHRGLTVDKGYKPTLTDLAWLLKTRFSIERALEKDPSTLNQSYRTFFKTFPGKNIRPLTATIKTDNWDVFKFLLTQQHLELNYQDDCSGPFHLLIENKEYARALELAQDKRFDIHQKNESGHTPFMVLVDHLIKWGVDLRDKEKVLIEKILESGLKGSKTIFFSKEVDLLALAAIDPQLAQFLRHLGYHLDDADLKSKQPLAASYFIEQLCDQVKLDKQVFLCDDALDRQVLWNRYRKIIDLLPLCKNAISPELHVKILKALSKAVVDFYACCENEDAKNCMNILTSMGAKVKQKHERAVFILLNDLPMELEETLSTPDFLEGVF